MFFFVFLRVINYKLVVKILLYILSLFILTACPTKGNASGKNSNEYVAEISQQSNKDVTADQLPSKDLLLSSAQISVTIGEESCSTTIAGKQHNGRYHSVKKSSSKLIKNIKNGKIIDEHSRPSYMDVVHVNSGMLSKGRYLFAIRKLRI